LPARNSSVAHGVFHVGANAFADESGLPAEKLGKTPGHRSQTLFWIRLTFGAPKVRGQDQHRSLSQAELNCRERLANPQVILDSSRFKGDVEVYAKTPRHEESQPAVTFTSRPSVAIL
jgi:hypothetical protein